MKILGIRITLQRPLDATTYTLVLLLSTKEGLYLSLYSVSLGLVLLREDLRVRSCIHTGEVRDQTRTEQLILTTLVGPPAF